MNYAVIKTIAAAEKAPLALHEADALAKLAVPQFRLVVVADAAASRTLQAGFVGSLHNDPSLFRRKYRLWFCHTIHQSRSTGRMKKAALMRRDGPLPARDWRPGCGQSQIILFVR